MSYDKPYFRWSVAFPDYEERIREMGLQVVSSILLANLLTLVPKE